MAATMNAATFMGRNFSTIQIFIMNSRDLTLKKMFDVTAQLVKDQEDWTKFIGERIHGKDCHWLVMKQLSRLLRFCVVPWKDPSTSGIQRSLEDKDWRGRDRETLQRL